MKKNNFLSKIQILFITFLLFSLGVTAQVGIGTTTPAGGSLLDLTSADKGFLVPRVNIANLNTLTPITPASASTTIGLLVWNTNVGQGVGYHYWNGTRWIPLGAGGVDWALAGNAITAANFLGTTNAFDLNIRTSNINRMRVQANGQTTVGFAATNANAGDQFSAVGSSAVNGYSGGFGTGVYGQNNAGGDGVWGINNGTGNGVWGLGTASGIGVRGESNSGIASLGISNSNVGVQGQSTLSAGVVGFGSTVGTIGIVTGGIGAQGQATTGDGVRGFSNTGDGVYGQGTTTGNGVVGFAGTTGDGVYGDSDSGNGILGISVSGAGMLGTSTDGEGSLSFSTTANGALGFSGPQTGTGSVGASNSAGAYTTLTSGSGLSGNGYTVGVFGFASDLTSDAWGGYFDNNGTAFSYVAGWLGFTRYKILGTGTVSTIVTGIDNQKLIMAAPESPEILFQDYGIGQLVNGAARINLDPNLVKNIRVDAEHPMKVFIQLEGDCNGVYVTNKSANGFDVKELQHGNSNVSFSWSITATRADEEITSSDGSVRISHNGGRFQPAPDAMELKKQKINQEIKETSRDGKEAKTVEEFQPLEISGEALEINSDNSDVTTKLIKVNTDKE